MVNLEITKQPEIDEEWEQYDRINLINTILEARRLLKNDTLKTDNTLQYTNRWVRPGSTYSDFVEFAAMFDYRLKNGQWESAESRAAHILLLLDYNTDERCVKILNRILDDNEKMIKKLLEEANVQAEISIT